MRGALIIGVLAAVAAGCVSAPAPQRVSFPRHDQPVGQAAQEEVLEAEVVFSNGCFFLNGPDGTQYLAVWPSNVEPRMMGTATVVGPGRELLLEAGAVGFVAGRAARRAEVEDLGAAIPERCASNSFWVVSEVVGRP